MAKIVATGMKMAFRDGLKNLREELTNRNIRGTSTQCCVRSVVGHPGDLNAMRNVELPKPGGKDEQTRTALQ
jgi:hypothetical protein